MDTADAEASAVAPGPGLRWATFRVPRALSIPDRNMALVALLSEVALTAAAVSVPDVAAW
jgi:hypothetical protein